jgi:hypothetical protein
MNQDVKLDARDQTPTAHTAINACPQGEVASGAIAMTPAKQPPTESGSAQNSGHDVTPVTSTNGRGDATVTCRHCGVTFAAKRPRAARYCSAACRQRAWLARNPEYAAERAAAWRAELRQRLEKRGVAWEER